jgi:biopolymer transport protein ExbD
MNFRPRRRDKPELNLIPMIDVLIVLLIFLVLTTTFRHESALSIRLPSTEGTTPAKQEGIEVEIDAESRIGVNGTVVAESSAVAVRQALEAAAGGRRDVPVVIRADRNTPHQAVMTVLDVAGSLGFTQILFATREGRAVP